MVTYFFFHIFLGYFISFGLNLIPCVPRTRRALYLRVPRTFYAHNLYTCTHDFCVNANSEFRSTIYLSDPLWHRTFSNYVYTQNVVVGILQSRRIMKEQVQLHRYTAIQLYSYTAVQLYSYTAIQLYSYTAVQLYSYTAIQLYSCTAVQLYSCIAIQLYSCIAIQLYSCIAVQLYSCIAVQLYSCIAV